MKNLTFTQQGNAYYSEVFQGGVTIQMAFPDEKSHAIDLETRLDSTLDWIKQDSAYINRNGMLTVNQSAAGQEFRIHCLAMPSAAVSCGLYASGPALISEDTEVISSNEVQTIGEDAAHSIVADAIAEIEGE